MADVLTPEQRRYNMQRVRGRDTNPEMMLRRGLHAMGFRYRLHAKVLPGRPDLVFPRHRAVIFVHGCFWHRHDGCRYATTPATRAAFWQTKFAANVVRDSAVHDQMLQAGWRVATVWECALRKSQQVEMAANILAVWLRSSAAEIEIGETDVIAKGDAG
ncbi:very short patch repair endonuclease [Hoeflea sp. AS60]|uniref:very short patch repair endonuclease n=1 Tax=Hoeflea sp. AS60 TaxID=3135780 RepID=UPI00317B072B